AQKGDIVLEKLERILEMQRLVSRKVEMPLQSGDVNVLFPVRQQIALHRPQHRIVDSEMLESAGIEVSAQFPVDALEDVQVELPRVARCVIVRTCEQRDVLLEVEAD